ncbi:transmembrane protein 53 [Copidosoma floridanum]|uniref:transmembrane protein 53 n=1 Tax=Copidosoma floridanum TaxID=29053 RepID=UPI0006C98BB1|nr:transmembrane protein 53 [Copidosoma floridanum]
MMGDELEYHFTFPPGTGAGSVKSGSSSREPSLGTTASRGNRPGNTDNEESSASSQGSSDDFVFVYDEAKRPLVVLLGWAGCQDKYLAKYSAIYEERSCITLRCTAPLACLFYRRHKLPSMSKRLLKVITEKCSDGRPVFFHVFSNGGAIFYQHISSAMQQAGSPIKVEGVIFDSSPGQRRIMSLYRAISAVMGGNVITNVPVSFAFTLFLSIFWFIEIVMHSLGSKNTVYTDPTALTEEKYSCPQLFLYSNADKMVSASDVEKFARKRAERGVRTQLVLFANSPHVKHYAAYRDVYVNAVCGFINECLMNERPAGSHRSTADNKDDCSDDGKDANSERICSDKSLTDSPLTTPKLTKRIVRVDEATLTSQ